MNESVIICVTALTIVAIIALVLSFKDNKAPESAVTYQYDEENRLKSIVPTGVVLQPVV